MSDMQSRSWTNQRGSRTRLSRGVVIALLVACAACSLPSPAFAQPKRSRLKLPQATEKVRAMLLALYAPKAWDRWAAAYEFGGRRKGGAAWQQEAQAAVPYLVEMLYDSTILEPEEAPGALGAGFGTWADVAMPSTPADGAVEALTALGYAGVHELAEIIRAGDSEFAARNAAKALGAIDDSQAAKIMLDEVRAGPPAVIEAIKPSLRRQDKIVSVLQLAAHDPQAAVREAAVYALGDRDNSLAVNELRTALNDPFWRVRRQAAESLGLKPDDGSIDPLLQAARYDPAGQVRAAAIESLTKFSDPRVGGAVRRALYDEAPEPRGAAALAAAQLHDKEAADRVIALLGDKDAAVRLAAAQAMAIMPNRCATLNLIKLLDDADAGIRRQAARTLGQFKDVRAADRLIVALDDAEPAVAAAAATALAAVNVPKGSVALLRALRRPFEPTFRIEVVNALAACDEYRAVEPILKLLDDPQPGVRAAADAAMRKLSLTGIDSEDATPPNWREWWKKEQSDATSFADDLGAKEVAKRVAAAKALRLNRDPRAPGLLIDALHDAHPTVRAAAAESISYHHDERAAPALLEALGDNDEAVAHQAALALYTVRDPAIVEPLLARTLFMEDATLQRRYIQTLGKIGDARAIEPLLTILTDPESKVQRPAATALAQITGHDLGYEAKDWTRWWALNRNHFTEAVAEGKETQSP